jgi:hypothetical protein
MFNPGTNALDLLVRFRVTIFATNAPASFAITVRSADFPTLQETILFPLVQDADNDRLSDLWERTHFSNNLTTASASTDFDGDGLTDFQEYAALDDAFAARTLEQRGNGGALILQDFPAANATNGFYRARATLP